MIHSPQFSFLQLRILQLRHANDRLFGDWKRVGSFGAAKETLKLNIVLIKAIQQILNILTVNYTVPNSRKTVLLTSQQFIDLLPAIELLTDCFIFIGSISHMILTSQGPGVL